MKFEGSSKEDGRVVGSVISVGPCLVPSIHCILAEALSLLGRGFLCHFQSFQEVDLRRVTTVKARRSLSAGGN